MNREFYEELMGECASDLQGFYGRTYYYYRQLSEEEKDRFCQDLEDNGVKTMLDFIMYMEE